MFGVRVGQVGTQPGSNTRPALTRSPNTQPALTDPTAALGTRYRCIALDSTFLAPFLRAAHSAIRVAPMESTSETFVHLDTTRAGLVPLPATSIFGS